MSDTRLSALDGILDELAGNGRLEETLPADLFAIADALAGSPTLRRAVTDPGTPEQARQALVHGLFDGKVSAPAADLVAAGAARRWAGGRTYASAIGRQGVRAQLMLAERAGQLDETEDELFRFARTVESEPGLRNLLADRTVPADRRQDLIGSLLENRATAATVALARRAVVGGDRSFGATLESYVTLAAQQKNRVIATVRVARPLTDDQLQRLRAGLARQVGRDVALQVIVEPDLLGGVRVELGTEVIEGTVSGRLAEARKLFS